MRYTKIVEPTRVHASICSVRRAKQSSLEEAHALISAYTKQSREVGEAREDAFTPSYTKSTSAFLKKESMTSAGKIRLEAGDFLKQDLSRVDIVFASASSCFDDTLAANIALYCRDHLPRDAQVVTLDKPLPSCVAHEESGEDDKATEGDKTTAKASSSAPNFTVSWQCQMERACGDDVGTAVAYVHHRTASHGL